MARCIINRILLGKLLLKEIDLPEKAELFNIKIHKNGLIQIEYMHHEEGGASLKTYSITKLTNLHTLS